MFCLEVYCDGFEQDYDRDREEEGIDDIDKPVGKVTGHDHLGDQLECITKTEKKAMTVSSIATIV